MRTLTEIESELDGWQTGADMPLAEAAQFVLLAETVLEHWLAAHDRVPTQDEREGFRLLALHRQAAKGDPSFNACRETCREVAYRFNLIKSDPAARETKERLEMMRRLVHHLTLFVSGKLQVAELGEFCCSSRPLRQAAQ
jgi:hypothetical protein